MRRALSVMGQQALALLYPRVRCIACGCEFPLEEGLCTGCRDAWRPAAQGCPAALIYEGAAAAAIARLKYEGERDVALWLGAAMHERLPEGPWDALVPIPLFPRRQRQRGYNQAEELARAVWRCGGPPVWRALRRVRATRQQVGLSRAERLANVRDAFAVCADVRAMRVLIIDDVLTTGATAGACAEALIRAGAARAEAWCAAYAPLP